MQSLDSTRTALAKLIDPAIPVGSRGAFLGSAFAVAPTIALSAFHCIGNNASGIVSIENVRLDFVTGQQIGAKLLHGDPDHDFAVFLLDTPLPESVVLVPLVRGVESGCQYRSLGFPVQVTLFALTAISGKIDNPTAILASGVEALQCQCEQMVGNLNLHGLSGAPVLVSHNGQEGAVGIVRQLQEHSIDDRRGVGNFFAASLVKSVIDSHPELDRYALDEVSVSAVHAAVLRATRGTPRTAEPLPPISPWVRMGPAMPPRGVDEAAPAQGESDKPLRHGDTIHFRFANALQARWKDPITSRIIALEEHAATVALARVRAMVDAVPQDVSGYVQCIPGFDVEIEWREATHVWGKLWGPIKRKSVRAFVDACEGKMMRGRIVRIANVARKTGRPEKQVTLRIQSDEYDLWLARDWPYYKGLESALSRNALYQSATALKLRQEGHLLPVANELVNGNLSAMIPSRYRYLMGDRPIDPLDVQLVLAGLIDQYVERTQSL